MALEFDLREILDLLHARNWRGVYCDGLFCDQQGPRPAGTCKLTLTFPPNQATAKATAWIVEAETESEEKE